MHREIVLFSDEPSPYQPLRGVQAFSHVAKTLAQGRIHFARAGEIDGAPWGGEAGRTRVGSISPE